MRSKRLAAGALAAVMMTGCAITPELKDALVIRASANEIIGDYEFSVFYMVKYHGPGGDVVLPDKFDTIPVYHIGERAFSECLTLTSIVIPAEVLSLNTSCFSGCKNLRTVIFKGDQKIPQNAFVGCSSLDNLNLNNYTISENAFRNCTGLKSLTLGEGVARIERYAFSNCKGLTSVTIPYNVEKLIGNAFCGCDNLTEIVVDELNPCFVSENNYIYTRDRKSLVAAPCAKDLTTVDIPYGVEEICEGAVGSRLNVSTVNIPDTVKTIGASAFNNCMGLKSLYIPDSVTTIDHSAFSFCRNLESIRIPSGVTQLDDPTFLSCDKLTIYCEKGSYAESFAKEKGIKYADISEYKDESKITPFVERLYTKLLNRSSDPTGLADWTSKLMSGKTAAEVAYGFLFSDEILNSGLSNEEFVTRMYETFLGRSPDAVGLADWVGALDNGCTIGSIFNGFVQSQEFGRICSDAGIKAGSYTITETRDANRNLTAFVSRMYTKAMKRSYDPVGLNDWTNRYLNQGAKIEDIAYGFIFSQEFLDKNLSDEDYVETLYETFFNRPSDAGGKNDWLDRMHNKGYERLDVLKGFVGSQECIALVKSFGI